MNPESNGPKIVEHKYTELAFMVTDDTPGRLADWLVKKCGFSHKAIKRIKHNGLVKKNGLPALMKDRVAPGDSLLIFDPQAAPSPYIRPETMPLDIRYEDNDVLVINKPAGICVHPNRRYPSGTLIEGVAGYLMNQGSEPSPHLVNRIDKDTSGLTLIAKHAYAARQLFIGQTTGSLRRYYLALAEGRAPIESGALEWPLVREKGASIRRQVCEPDQEGQTAKTHYQVVKRFKAHTLFTIWLETGRTHQIRAHFSHWGYPLAGDELYGGSSQIVNRQFLHAYLLEFIHPIHSERMSFKAELPEDLSAALKIAKQ